MMLFFCVILPIYAILIFGWVNYHLYKKRTMYKGETQVKLLSIA